MSFHEQAQNVRVENNKILKAQLKNADGQFVDAEIDLDQFIGNDNGKFSLQFINARCLLVCTSQLTTSSFRTLHMGCPRYEPNHTLILDGYADDSVTGFSGSAENVTCSLEGAAGVPILRADLANAAGEKTAHDLNLGERIRNVNGQFQYGMYP